MKGNQVILDVNAKNRQEAIKWVGKRVVFTTPSGKEIKGVIFKPHGNKGKVVARFRKGIPGQAITQPIKLTK